LAAYLPRGKEALGDEAVPAGERPPGQEQDEESEGRRREDEAEVL